MAEDRRRVELTRTSTGNYQARNQAGVTVEVGISEDLFSPVELLLAAIGACSAIDVDVVTSRRAEPTDFRVEVSGDKTTDESDGARMQDIVVDFTALFGDDEKAGEAAGLVERLVRLSHDKDCTVSRTVELPTRVRMDVAGRTVAGS
ncbi:putative OsmC-like protein [Luteococcus japonicus]|uniref:Putative OsmC-like protein n=1 Tax=Luteococcus japonicus TaxID=33984 RepID=A0A3N1ZVG4_9ACTN|nr:MULTISPECIES: OsmC family protein [Luteococcus]MDN5563267.1 OsmC family protein [Luteococcus sp.]ROR54841.1 putative OsmC-like protein [Luteococcus japonicus]